MTRRRRGTGSRNISEFKEKERLHGLGKRDRRTLPGWNINNESCRDNEVKSRKWRAVGRWAASTAAVGAKYV